MGKIVAINMVIDFHKKVMKISPSDLAKNVDSSQGMVIANMEVIANIFMVVEILDQRMEPITKRSREGTRGEGGKQKVGYGGSRNA